MTRRQAEAVIAGIAAIGLLGTAPLHSAGYSSVVRASAQAPEMVRGLLPMPWLQIGFDFAVLGILVGVVAFRPGGPARIILVVAAICPLATAGPQIRFIGFIPPTAILIGVGIVTLIGAMIAPSTGVTPVNLAE